MPSLENLVSFGPFVLDVEGAELRKNGERVAVRPKCFDVLVYLAARPGQVVSKEELLEKVWPDVVVSDATLNRTVTELRAALGDDADNPLYILTVSRRGYKFVAELAELQKPAEAPGGAAFALVHDKREHLLNDGDHLLGRGADVSIPIFASAASRHHARITVEGRTITVEDLGSRNGTYVNGERVTARVPLSAGDEIRIGTDCLIVWSRESETASL